MTPTTPSKLGLETIAAIAATAISGTWLFLTTINAGPLWRDEVNSLNLAQMPFKEMWENLHFDSCPLLWILLLRAWNLLELTHSDAGVRVLGLITGWLFLASLWLSARWAGGRTPTLALALLGSLPALLFAVTSNRAYGLSLCLLTLTFGSVWRLATCPSRQTILWAGMLSLLFVHCLYYNALFLCAMLVAGGVVSLRRRQWKAFASLTVIGVCSALSLLVYLPVINRGSKYVSLGQAPFGIKELWERLGDAVGARSNAQLTATSGIELWVWIFLGLLAGAAGLISLARKSPGTSRSYLRTSDGTDLALFSLLTLVAGTLTYSGFLLRLDVPTQRWYYTGLLTLAAISFDAVLTVRWPSLRPFGLLRIASLGLLTVWYMPSAWQESHTRRSNLDVVATALAHEAKEGDLIIVHFAWEGITFDRYYRGKARWLTVPPIDSHKVHRADLVQARLYEPDPTAPLRMASSEVLQQGNSVWFVGRVPLLRQNQLPTAPIPPAPNSRSRLNPHGGYWGAKIAAHLVDTSTELQTLTLRLDRPVSVYENLPAYKFSGLRGKEDR